MTSSASFSGLLLQLIVLPWSQLSQRKKGRDHRPRCLSVQACDWTGLLYDRANQDLTGPFIPQT